MNLSVKKFVRYPHLNSIGKYFRADRMRTDFLDAASHELKTPLTSLKLQMQLISKMASPATESVVSPERLKLLAEDAERQITRMTQVINSMLDASDMKAGKLDLKLESFDLAQMVREIVKQFKEDPAFSNVQILLNAPQSIPGIWDRNRVAQVIKSILANAIQYGLRKPVEISIWADRSWARISVKDQGIGIPEEDRERIFRQFERCVPGEKFNGLGLGLYMSRQIALAHKGSIRVESKEGEGSIFTVKLPRDPEYRLQLVL